MVKLHPSMASDHIKHNHLNNLNSLSKKPPAHRITFHGKKSETSAKLVEQLHVKESRFSKNADEEPILEVYPFVEEPVLFNFGDDYGMRLFLDFKNEISFESDNDDHGRRLFLGAVEEMDDRSGGDVYAFSPEADVIASFSKDGLF